MKVTLVFCLLVAVYANKKPCVSPEQWEGRVVTYDTRKSLEMKDTKVCYDEINKRVRIIDGHHYIFKLYKMGKKYSLHKMTRRCEVTTLTEPFRRIGVPAAAQYNYTATIGYSSIPNEHVTVDTFSWKARNDMHFAVVTSPDCIPVQNSYSNGTSVVINAYFDIEIGIMDPAVFIPPTECTNK